MADTTNKNRAEDQPRRSGRASAGLLIPALALLLSVTAGYVGWLSEQAAVRTQTDNAHWQVRDELSLIRTRLEAVVNSNLLLASGMAAFISANPNLHSDEFDAIAASLLAHGTQVLNITGSRGTLISYVYPKEGNVSVLGTDYRDLPAQWPGVDQIVKSGKTRVLGPYSLIQGGRAMVGRTPVMVDDGQGGQTFWGLVSVPIGLESLLRAAGALDASPLRIALRTMPDGDEDAHVFYGDSDLFDTSSVIVDLRVPESRWQIAGVPLKGWPSLDGMIWSYRAATGFLVLLILIGAYFIQRAMTGHGFAGPRGRASLRGNFDGGLLSRSGLYELAEAEMTAARRQGRAVAALQIEIDDYPALVRVLGVSAMREILEKVGAASLSALRPSDALAHLDGGIYAALLIGAGRDGAVMAGDRVRRAVKALRLHDGEGRHLTVSVGVVARGDGEADGDLQSLLARAASRLAEGRRGGIDRVAA